MIDCLWNFLESPGSCKICSRDFLNIAPRIPCWSYRNFSQLLSRFFRDFCWMFFFFFQFSPKFVLGFLRESISGFHPEASSVLFPHTLKGFLLESPVVSSKISMGFLLQFISGYFLNILRGFLLKFHLRYLLEFLPGRLLEDFFLWCPWDVSQSFSGFILDLLPRFISEFLPEFLFLGFSQAFADVSVGVFITISFRDFSRLFLVLVCRIPYSDPPRIFQRFSRDSS